MVRDVAVVAFALLCSAAPAVAASGMFFQPTGRRLQVLAEDAGAGKRGQLLATVALSDSGTPGGGGPAIVGDTIYIRGYKNLYAVGN